MHECSTEAATIRNELKAQKRKHLKGEYRSHTYDIMLRSNVIKLAVDIAKEKGVCSWLSVLPIEEFGFLLHIYKGACAFVART